MAVPPSGERQQLPTESGANLSSGEAGRVEVPKRSGGGLGHMVVV